MFATELFEEVVEALAVVMDAVAKDGAAFGRAPADRGPVLLPEEVYGAIL